MTGVNVNGGDVKMTELNEGTCCVCKHPLSSHVDEGYGWRCHILSDDLYQCECFLRKRESRWIKIDNRNWYDLKRRIEQHEKEMKNDVSNSSTVKPFNSSTQKQEEVVKVGGKGRVN